MLGFLKSLLMAFELTRRSGELDICRGRLSGADELLAQSQTKNMTLNDQVSSQDRQIVAYVTSFLKRRDVTMS